MEWVLLRELTTMEWEAIKEVWFMQVSDCMKCDLGRLDEVIQDTFQTFKILIGNLS